MTTLFLRARNEGWSKERVRAEIRADRLRSGTVAVIGRKGGAGKTTTSLGLAGALEALGAPVTLLDLDPQASLSRMVSADGPRVLALGEAAQRAAERGRVHDWLSGILDEGHGWVIIDTPPAISLIMLAAIELSEKVLVVTRLTQQDIDSLLDTMAVCKPQETLVVPNAVTRYRAHRDALDALHDSYDAWLWQEFIPESAAIVEASNAGLPVCRVRPRSVAARAYALLAEECLA